MDPSQYFHPKQSIFIKENGKIVSPPLEDMSPMLNRKKFKKEMIIPIHNKSKNLNHQSNNKNLSSGM